MKADKMELIAYLKNNKDKLVNYFKTTKELENFITLLEGELINKNIRVFYFTECMTDINGGRSGKQFEYWYESIEKAMSAPLPEGCVSGCIFAEEGTYYLNKNNGWEFYKQ